MFIKVISATYLEQFRLRLTFNDNLVAEVDLKNSLQGKIYKALKTIDTFKKFRLNSWTIEWDNGADFAPEYLYQIALEQKKELEKA